MIVILDYGMGNTGSMLNMITRVGGDAIISNRISDIKETDALILPGVGAFDNGMLKLKESGILSTLNRRVIVEKIPFLGVCLGMQLMFEESEEGHQQGLGWFSGKVQRFHISPYDNKRIKIPHMGWNKIIPQQSSKLLSHLEHNSKYYFVHSYHVNCKDENNILATSNHGYSFPCAVSKENIMGVQFHPEKSHSHGIKLFMNFLEIIKCSKRE